ncbi:MAG: lysoplasmalogenase [Gemmatimonadota bacterium]|nr:lysoplasmalogenase [Gemmatimonadota bacterium]MDH5282932.1 lysoplasmalogenase [Gemmatimonadota bacterium]
MIVLPGPAMLAAAALSALLHLRAEYQGPRWQVYLFKPLTTTLLLLLAAFSPSAHGPRYQLFVVVGLACSLAGDVFLMLPRDRFLPGLASFLLAHLAYVAAFSSGVPFDTAPLLFLPLVAVAIPLLRLLWPSLGRLRLPVLLYAATILVMVWRAWARPLALPSVGAAIAAVGATLFMVSDAILALNRFHRHFRSAQTLIMATYVAAQALIAISAGVE